MPQPSTPSHRAASSVIPHRLLRLEALEPRVLLSASTAEEAMSLFALSPALFVENQGQWADAAVRYAHDGSAANVAMMDSAVAFQVFRDISPANGDPASALTQMRQFSASFVGANTVTPVGLDPAEAKFNYHLGDDPSLWREGVSSYQTISYQGLYDGVDLLTWGLRDHLKYEFHVAAGADWQQIQVRYDGIGGLSLADDGTLLVNMGGDWGTLVDDAPVVYQEIGGQRVEVAAQFVLLDPYTYTFQITGDYDPSQALVIDPSITWSTYLGSGLEDRAQDVAMNTVSETNPPAFRVYVTGFTRSAGWAAGGFDTSFNGVADAFVAALDTLGGHLWTTYLGGSAYDSGTGIAVQYDANTGLSYIYVTGFTSSSGWTVAGYDISYNGSGDAFVAKLSPSGGHVWSTYLGGTFRDAGAGVAAGVDPNDGLIYVYVTGDTESANWVSNGFDVSHNGASDAFVVRLTDTGAHDWSTYLGGTTTDWGASIAVDTQAFVYVAGGTYSANWVSGGFDTSFNGVIDGFVARLNYLGAHSWSTYLGGAAIDRADGLTLNGTTDIYVTGYTESAGWTAGGFDTTYNGAGDAFVMRMTTAGAHTWSTYLGGTAQDYGRRLDLGPGGTVFVTGETASTGWVFGGFDIILGGTWDGFVTKLTAAGGYTWSTYIGAANEDRGTSIFVNTAGDIYAVGYTGSDLWIAGGYDTSYGGQLDGYVVRIQDSAPLNAPPMIASVTAAPTPVPQGSNVTLTALGVADLDGTVALVSFYRDTNGNGAYDVADAFLGSDPSAVGGWTWVENTAAWAIGPHTVFAIAQDNQGALSTPVAGTVQVGSQPPVITTLTAVPDPVTRPNNFTLTATGVSDPDGTVTQVAFYRDVNGNAVWDATDALLGTDTFGGDGWDLAVSTAGWALGPYTLFARARDNNAVWGPEATTTVTVNGANTPPTIGSLTAFPDPVERPNPLTLTANTVADAETAIALVSFYRDDNGNNILDGPDVLLGTDNNALNGWSLTFSTSGWALGPYTFFAQAQDIDGALSTAVMTTAVVQNPVILVGDGAARSLTYWDAAGTKVTITMKGGIADLTFTGDWALVLGNKGFVLNGVAELDTINLLGTTAASKLSFKTSGRHKEAVLGTITGAGDMGAIDGRNMQLMGNIALGGSLGSLSLLEIGPNPTTIDVLSLGTLQVALWIESLRLTSLGDIASITAGGLRNSSIFAAVAVTNDLNVDGVLDLPNPATDFAGVATIGRVTITGKVWDATDLKLWGVRPPSLVNSNVAAWNINDIRFSYAQTDNGAWPFGFASRSIGAMSYFDNTVAVKFKPLAATYVNGDLEVRLG